MQPLSDTKGQAFFLPRKWVALAAVVLALVALVVVVFGRRDNERTVKIVVPQVQPPAAAVTLPEGYVTYGPYDADGIPLRDFGGDLGVVYHPLVVAEFGSYYAGLAQTTRDEKYLRGLRKMADWLVGHMSQQGFWVYGFPNSYGGLYVPQPWVSAVTQGFGAQTLIKAGRILGEPRYIEVARKALLALLIPVDAGGVRVTRDGGYFFEEVPSRYPTHILNGHLTSLMALQDYLALGQDAQLEEAYQKGLVALDAVLPMYDTGYWSRYDLIPPMEAGTQYLVLGVSRAEVPRVTSVGERGNIQLKGVPGKVDVARYARLDGGALDAHLDYYEVELGGTFAGEWALSADFEVEAGGAVKAFLSWPENRNLLIALQPTGRAAGKWGLSLPGVQLGHATGQGYHRMMIEQLEILGRATNKKSLLTYADRWRGYERLRRHLVERQ